MLNGSGARSNGGIMELVSGIITDIHALSERQFALFLHDIKAEIAQLREAGSLMAAGLAVLVIGIGSLSTMLVHLLAEMWPDLPLWACYGIVGAPIAALGGILCMAGYRKIGTAAATATAKTAHDLKETVHDSKENVHG